jgi:hypothetical protein
MYAMLHPKESSLQLLETEFPLQVTGHKGKHRDRGPAAYLETFYYTCPTTDKPAGNLKHLVRPKVALELASS